MVKNQEKLNYRLNYMKPTINLIKMDCGFDPFQIAISFSPALILYTVWGFYVCFYLVCLYICIRILTLNLITYLIIFKPSCFKPEKLQMIKI